MGRLQKQFSNIPHLYPNLDMFFTWSTMGDLGRIRCQFSMPFLWVYIEPNIDTLESSYYTNKGDMGCLWKQLSNIPCLCPNLDMFFTRSTIDNLGRV
jgi:hypothetical protein